MSQHNGFPLKLVRLRADAGMTQRDLAVASGISVPQIGRYEAGISKPRMTALVKLAKALGVEPEALQADGEPDDVELMFEVTFEKLGPVRCSLHFSRDQHKKLAEEYSSIGQKEKDHLLGNYMVEALVGAAKIEGSPLQLRLNEDEITKVSARIFAPKEYIDEIRGTPIFEALGGSSNSQDK